jgi:hypothetical protein
VGIPSIKANAESRPKEQIEKTGDGPNEYRKGTQNDRPCPETSEKPPKFKSSTPTPSRGEGGRGSKTTKPETTEKKRVGGAMTTELRKAGS